ncbi:dual specificity protein phosphatase CDC14A-like [Anopheles maculipalpis]|uniref:dual specificity protein phosphatase CDC14A-like n=1 Tax=Anopheles maculipalpis TaxID=1496333 RepID=UPI0021596C76|nr:dual specificity protein phosphatase CDC14A-like [Anopheles maculipalpis]
MARNNQNIAPLHSASSDDEMCETENNSLLESVPILPGRIQMAIMTKKPTNEPNSAFFYFTTDEQLVYANFYQDFGPLNLAKLYRFCNILNSALQDEAHEEKTFVYYTRKDPKKILNAAYLIGSFCIIYHQFGVPALMKMLGPILKQANGAKFCDASLNDLTFLSLKDCFGGIRKAVQRNFFNFNDFNLIDYEHYECVENGDFNWIVPGKLLAFCGPNSRTERTSDSIMLGPEEYIDYFLANNVTTVVRLNSPRYDSHAFMRHGIQHHDLYFSDGTSPSERLAKQFLKIVENSRGAVAVHCKAGLGRTGTLIAAYLMKHYQFTAMESIAWLRVCRPGSVIGQQQTWLISKQSQLLQEGEIFRQQRHHVYIPPERHEYGVYSMVKHENAQNASQTPIAQSTATGTTRELDSENVQRISQRVDTMRLNDEDDQEGGDRVDSASLANNNIVHCKLIRMKKVAKVTTRHTRWTRFSSGRTVVSTATSMATTVRRGRGYITPLGGTPQQRTSLQDTLVNRKKTVTTRPEANATPSAVLRNQRNASIPTASQGDQLNSIKAARRQHVPTDASQQKINNTKMTTPPATITSSQADNSARPVVSALFAALDANKGDSAELAVSSSSATMTRKDTLKKNHSEDASISLPSHTFVAIVTTQVNQGKEIVYEFSLDCNLIVQTLLPRTLLPAMKKMKTSEVVVLFKPGSDYEKESISFAISLDMTDVLSIDRSAADAQNINVLNGYLRTALMRKEPNKVMHPVCEAEAIKLTENSIPAKLTWLLNERNRLKIRVCFDTMILAEAHPHPAYLLGLIKTATTLPVLSSPPRRHIKTTVMGMRESNTDQRVLFGVRLNLKWILERRRGFGGRARCSDMLKSVPQPGSSKGFKPAVRYTKSHSATAMEVEDSIGDTSLDHNGNNAASAAASSQQEKKEPIVPTTRTTSTATAETDISPSKRFRFDASRQW